MDYIRIGQRTTDNSQQSLSTTQQLSNSATQQLSCQQITTQDVKELLKDWIKLYPNSFAPDVDFKIYQLADGDIIIQLHEDLSSMAVSLLVLYFETTVNRQQSTDFVHNSATQQLINIEAYITIDDTEVLLKQNEGKRAMVFCSHQVTKSPRHQGLVTEPVEVPTANSQQTSSTTQQLSNSATQQLNNQQLTAVRFLLEDNYVLDYNFEKRPQPVKDCDLVFEETEFSLPEEYESVRVGDVVKKKIDEVLEEGLTPTKLLIYFLCGAIGLSIGFLIVYFMGK